MGENNKTIKTPSGVEVVIKTQMNAREFRELRSIYTRDLSIDSSDPKNPRVSGLKGDVLEEAENKALTLMVVSIGGKNDNILETLLDMDMNDYQAVLDAVNEVTNIESKKKAT